MSTASSGRPTWSTSGLFTAAEFASFERAERFLWAVRCHLHLVAGRAEERLGFDHQRADRARRCTTPTGRANRRSSASCNSISCNAKTVGDLTGLFLAQLDEQLGKKGFRFALPTIRRRPKRLDGFMLDRGRLSIPDDGFLAEDPVRLIELFALAARERLEIHPNAMRAAARDAKLIDARCATIPRANALFLDVLTDRDAPELVLRWMNEAGVFGRFVPDFGRVVAQMQFDMYHHYTVDEHSIRAIGLLAAIERGELAEDHPLSTALFRQIASRRDALCRGAAARHRQGPRRRPQRARRRGRAEARARGFGLDAAETETVAWLVRHHLLMSATAFKRDLADPKTIEDFVRAGAEPGAAAAAADPDRRRHPRGRPGRLERAGSAQLLRTLFDAAEERLRLGHKQRGRTELVAARQEELAAGAGLEDRRSRAPTPGACPTAIGWPSRSNGSSPMRARSPRPKRASASRSRASSPRTTPRAARPGSASSRPTAQGLFYRICAGLSRGRREHHRRAHPHHPRRHGARQSAGASTARAAPMPTAGCASAWSDRSRRR